MRRMTIMIIDNNTSITNTNNKNTGIIVLDGSYGEGGGQILRNSISFATVLPRPLRVNQIRAGRTKPGLKAQHVASLELPCRLSVVMMADTTRMDQNKNNKEDVAASRGSGDHDNNLSQVLQGSMLHSTSITYTPPALLQQSTTTKEDTTWSTTNHNHHPYNQNKDNTSSNTIPTPASSFSDQSTIHLTQDIGTAGSICLVLQATLPVALLATKQPVHITLLGGTNATLAPQYDYWTHVFVPIFQQQCVMNMGNNDNDVADAKHWLPFDATVVRRGYFPKGGGQVDVHVHHPLTTAQTLRPVQMTQRGTLLSLSSTAFNNDDNNNIGKKGMITIRAFYAGTWPRAAAEGMVQAAQKVLQQHASEFFVSSDKNSTNTTATALKQQQLDIQTELVEEQSAIGNGMGLLIVATTTTGCKLAGSALCNKGYNFKAAQATGLQAAFELVQTWRDGGCVDEWLQDQLILYMALAAGKSRLLTGSLTLHTRTAIWVAEQMTGAQFWVQKLDDVGEEHQQPQQTQTTGHENEKTETDVKKPKLSNPSNNKSNYGTDGRIAGRHLIEVIGIGVHGKAP